MVTSGKIDVIEGNVFDLLDSRLQKILPKKGIVSPTPIQEKAIPHILSGGDAIISSPTGTGKTEAAMLPLFSKMLKWIDAQGYPETPLTIYITPLRALNRDIHYRLQEISREIGLEVMVRHGDSTRKERREFVKNPPTWFITTPESFTLMISNEYLRPVFSGIKWVVVDEIHELIDSERGSSLVASLSRLKKLCGKYQFIGISATIPDEEVFRRFYPCRKNCKIIVEDIRKETEYTVLSPPQTALENPGEHFKWVLNLIHDITRSSRSTLIFTNTRDTAELLGYKVREKGMSWVEVHHGSLSFNVRKKVEEDFKNGRIKAVIATSSLELGIDIGDIEIVMQYGSPRQAVRLVQRAGRSGHRIGLVSKGIIIAEPSLDDIVESTVIARRALEGQLEPVRVHDKPIDVIAHQIVGMVISGEAKTIDDIVETLRKSYPFRNITKDEVMDIVEFLQQAKLVRLNENGILGQSRRSRTYYYSTTLIPDTRKIPVYSIHGERIGFLDEDFVVAKLDRSTNFLLAGREWTVLDISDEKIIVEEVLERTGLPPSWEGDLIPVDRKVAREACSLIKRIHHEEEYDKIVKNYPGLSKNAYAILKKIADMARKKSLLPPGPNYVLLEEDLSGKVVVLYTCLGTMGNDALALVLSGFIGSRYGRKVSVYSDPYRIFVEVHFGRAVNTVLDAIKDLSLMNKDDIVSELVTAAKKSPLFYWRVAQVARKMGVISREARFEDVRRMVRYMGDTLVGKEALRELLVEKLDVDGLISFFDSLKNGKLKVVLQRRKGFSPYTIFSSKAIKQMTSYPQGIPSELAIKILEKRILEKKMLLVCIKCGFEWEAKVKDLPDIIQCRKCGSRAIAPIPSLNVQFVESVRKFVRSRQEKKFRGKEREYIEDAIKRANLVLSHGKIAVIALTPYGVGPRGASKAISRLKLGWEEFLKTLYDEERNFLRTRKYWD